MALTKEQQRVASTIIKKGKKSGASHKEILSAIETGIVESGLRNLKGGDADSSGWRQERAAYYPAWNKRSGDDAKRYFAEAKRVNSKNMSAGQLAQTVQRSAYPERYDQVKGQAKSIIQAIGGRIDTGGKSSSKTTKGKTLTTPKSKVMTAPAVDNETERKQAALAFIQTEDKTAADYAGFKSTMSSLADQKAQYKTIGGDKVKIPGMTTKQAKAPKAKKANKQASSAAPQNIVKLGKIAQRMGLHVGENPKFGGVSGGHVSGSYHYSNRAIDVSGDPKLMKKYAKKMDRKYGDHLAELFWNGSGARNRDNGKRVPKGYVSGHTDHVHVAV